MESEIIFLIIIGAVILVFSSWRSRSKNDSWRRSHDDPQVGLSPFDAKSAKSQPRKTVLSGSAYVIDGDTVVVQKTQIRLFGVDAPEINHPYGQKAKWALVNLCKGQIVRAETIEQDDYGRIVARCYLQDGSDLSAEMVKLGLAIDWPKFSDGEYQALEMPGIRKKLWLADARQKGRIHIWKQFEARQSSRATKD